MLCESLLHLLVEQHVITLEEAIEAIEGIAELMHAAARTRRSSPLMATSTSVSRDLVRAIMPTHPFTRTLISSVAPT